MFRGQSFDLDEWVESVEGETVKITTPDSLGYKASKCYTSPTKYDSTFCGKCQDYHLLVKFEDEIIGHCPKCGREPGALELGTRKQEWK